MSIRPFRDIKRKKTKEINVGKVKVGGNNPISVQSMTNTLTTDVKATIDQIHQIQNEGACLQSRKSCSVLPRQHLSMERLGKHFANQSIGN